MSDLGKLDVGDWLSLAVVSISAGVGSAMAWFKSSNNKRDDKTTVLENRMNNYEAVRATQATQLAVLETCQQNIQDKLGEIKEDIANSAQAGAHSVNQQLAFMLTEVQKIVSHNNKRGHE